MRKLITLLGVLALVLGISTPTLASTCTRPPYTHTYYTQLIESAGQGVVFNGVSADVRVMRPYLYPGSLETKTRIQMSGSINGQVAFWAYFDLRWGGRSLALHAFATDEFGTVQLDQTVPANIQNWTTGSYHNLRMAWYIQGLYDYIYYWVDGLAVAQASMTSGWMNLADHVYVQGITSNEANEMLGNTGGYFYTLNTIYYSNYSPPGGTQFDSGSYVTNDNPSWYHASKFTGTGTEFWVYDLNCS